MKGECVFKVWLFHRNYFFGKVLHVQTILISNATTSRASRNVKPTQLKEGPLLVGFPTFF